MRTNPQRQLTTAMALAIIGASVAYAEQPKRPESAQAVLSPSDRVGIETLIARYSLALGTCDAEKYASAFVEPDGSFSSSVRGKVQGHHRLVEMNHSYNCVYDNGIAPPHAPVVMVPYKLELSRTPSGAVGTAYYNGGRYDDVYVKVGGEWRFKSRTVITNAELATGLTGIDFEAIQQLASATGGPFVDYYEQRPDGIRFKSSGVSFEASADGVKGAIYLQRGGHYVDVYVRSADGWRLKSRTFVPSPTASANGSTAASTPSR